MTDVLKIATRALKRSAAYFGEEVSISRGARIKTMARQRDLRIGALDAILLGRITADELDRAAQSLKDVQYMGNGTGLRSARAILRDDLYIKAAIILASGKGLA